MIVLLAACAGSGPSADGVDTSAPSPRVQGAAMLADMTLWGDATSPDPLPDHRPDGADCAASGVLLEGSTLEVNTGLCAYAFLEQPLLADLRPGDDVEVVLWHSALVSTEPAEGHFALLVDGELLWERIVPIPTDADAYTDRVQVSLEAEAGAPLQLHLHNHGSNTWNLLRVERNPSR